MKNRKLNNFFFMFLEIIYDVCIKDHLLLCVRVDSPALSDIYLITSNDIISIKMWTQWL